MFGALYYLTEMLCVCARTHTHVLMCMWVYMCVGTHAYVCIHVES